jgi:two-component system, NarL family, nitrate/nitrite response regulator NarL
MTVDGHQGALRIAVVDDHPVARHGIASILSGVPDIAVTAAVETAAELPRTADGAVDADVVLLDLYQGDGALALAAIAEFSAHRPVLVISASRAPADVLAALQAGASGYLTKQAGEAAYVTALRTVAGGECYLSAQLADLIQAATLGGTLGRAGAGAVPRPEEKLSPREQEALSFIARGFTHQQTATRMGVSKTTVDTYIARIRTKLQLGNKAELTIAALRYLPHTPES